MSSIVETNGRRSRPSSGDFAQVLAQLSEMRAKVDSQVAAPAEIEDAQLAPSENSLTKSADGRMATEAARLK